MKIPMTVVSIRSAKPDYVYGELANILLKSAEKSAEVKAAIPADIPANAIITKADAVYAARVATTGTRNYTMRGLSANFKVSRATWNNSPALTGTTFTKSVGTVAVDGEIRVGVLSDVQGFVSGSITNRGWRLNSSEAADTSLHGATASEFQPYLDLEWAEPSDAPTDLQPAGGVVAVSKPVLTFVGADDISSIQVHIDSGQDGVAPDFDTGTVAATAGVLDLAGSWVHTGSVTKTSGSANLTAGTFVQADVGAAITGTGIPASTTILSIGGGGTTAVMSANATSSGTITATITRTYPGLSNTATTSWRARTFGAGGWSDWSPWASFTRVDQPTVTITGPASTSGDKTPTVTWTAAGQQAWRAIYRNAVTGAIVEQTTWEDSTDLSWTPTKGLRTVGQQGEIEVRVLDGQDRIPTPGQPTYAFDTQTFTLVEASAAAGVTTLTATATVNSPVVALAWTGAAADEWQIKRDSDWLERIAGGLTAWSDYTAAPGVLHTYKVLRVTAGVVSPNGPSAVVTPATGGAWLLDPDTAEKFMMADEDVQVTMAEQAVIHNVLDEPAVRRRVGTPPPSGTATGTFVDGLSGLAADFNELAMSDFKKAAQSHVFRLIWADRNVPVTIGDLTCEPYREGGSVLYAVSFSWWHDGSEPWED